MLILPRSHATKSLLEEMFECFNTSQEFVEDLPAGISVGVNSSSSEQYTISKFAGLKFFGSYDVKEPHRNPVSKSQFTTVRRHEKRRTNL